jgi:hypothetical protein
VLAPAPIKAAAMFFGERPQAFTASSRCLLGEHVRADFI